MIYKRILMCMMLLGYISTGFGQKVKRKGVEPIAITKKEVLPDYSIRQLDGRWQEVKRKRNDSKDYLSFSDTLLLKFTGDKVEVKDAISMRMSVAGAVQLNPPNILVAAGDEYMIRSLDTANLVLDDSEITRNFIKKQQFYAETVGYNRVVKDSFSAPVPVNLKDIMGKWQVYSKQAAPGSVKAGELMIKSITVESVHHDGNGSGAVTYFDANQSTSTACKFQVKDGVLQIISPVNTWSFNVYKAKDNELVFGDVKGLLYYSKKF